MTARLTDIIARETYGKSYKARKYSLDYPAEEHPQQNESTRIWQKSAEASPRSTYINLLPLSQKLAQSGEQILSYFIDGSRRAFKVDEIAYEYSGGRRALYPVIAGEIGAGCCRRTGRKMKPERVIHEVVVALPNIADPDGRAGFFEALALKLNESPSLKRTGIKISGVLPYKTDRTGVDLEDKGIACIQSKMLDDEKKLTEYIAKRLNHRNYLVKDGSLEYRKDTRFNMQNYRWVIGVSKTFNPEACFFRGREDSGCIADLPAGHRTQAACFTNPEFLGDVSFAVWYIRLHDRARTRSAFDGVIKAEKMLVTQTEREQGTMSSDELDVLSAYLFNERSPVCYGRDSRWANHIYPVYMTESFIKSKYLSTETFLQLF